MLDVGKKIVCKSQKSVLFETVYLENQVLFSKNEKSPFTENLDSFIELQNHLEWLVNRYMHEVYQFMPSTTICSGGVAGGRGGNCPPSGPKNRGAKI